MEGRIEEKEEGRKAGRMGEWMGGTEKKEQGRRPIVGWMDGWRVQKKKKGGPK